MNEEELGIIIQNFLGQELFLYKNKDIDELERIKNNVCSNPRSRFLIQQLIIYMKKNIRG